MPEQIELRFEVILKRKTDRKMCLTPDAEYIKSILHSDHYDLSDYYDIIVNDKGTNSADLTTKIGALMKMTQQEWTELLRRNK